MFPELIRKSTGRLPARVLIFIANLWFPFRGAGIRIIHASPDYRRVEVQMRLTWFNRNYVGTHFGGSLYALTDPFYMMMLINNLGSDYIVWDKAAKIEFIKPGRGTVSTSFILEKSEIEQIKSICHEEGRYIFDKTVDVVNKSGEVVASVIKTLYVRNKNWEVKQD
ncbi:MAG: DUF4442 domain-containing protein [Proteobacteria bacterium]|nr:DUF4442 domain-containing protein [Pseudomonadota bacterium]